jgi:hypothetical protein
METIAAQEVESIRQQEVITINQGRPNSPYFLAAESPRNAKALIGDLVNCINPRTKHVTKGRVVDSFTFPWNEAPRGLILLEYGVQPGLLMAALRSLDPVFEDDWVILLLIVEIQ